MKKLCLTFLLVPSMLCGNAYVPAVKRARADLSNKLKKEKQLSCWCSGGAMMHQIEEITLKYAGKQSLTVSEARRLYVEAAEIFFKRINDDDELRPHLANYPFGIQNFDFGIAFFDDNGERRDGECVSYMFAAKGDRIIYSGYDHDKKTFTDLHEESYEEALRIVQEEGYLDNIQYIEPKQKRSFLFWKN